MCKVCRDVKKTIAGNGGFLTDDQQLRFLQQIPDDSKHADELIDLILGTKLPERDEAAEKAWQELNRKDG